MPTGKFKKNLDKQKKMVKSFARSGNLQTPKLGAEAVFKKDYMRNMIGKHFPGEDDPQVNVAMEKILNGEVDEALEILEKQVPHLTKPRARNEYNRYLEELNKDKTGNTIAHKAKDLDTKKKHKNYLGSTWSLRFGKVIGDALGLDPIFGALMNPSGGLVGPGNDGAMHSDGSYVAYHGVFHDAGGYLLKAFDIGPGYDYLGEDHRDPRNAMTGQREGLRWWRKQKSVDQVLTNPLNYKEIQVPDWLLDNPIGADLTGYMDQTLETVSTHLHPVKETWSNFKKKDYGAFTKNIMWDVPNSYSTDIFRTTKANIDRVKDGYDSTKKTTKKLVKGAKNGAKKLEKKARKYIPGI